jgi:hypothetical protein
LFIKYKKKSFKKYICNFDKFRYESYQILDTKNNNLHYKSQKWFKDEMALDKIFYHLAKFVVLMETEFPIVTDSRSYTQFSIWTVDIRSNR